MKSKQPTTEILFARHGESVANAEGYLAGQLDVELTPEGEQQATETGRQLLAAGKIPDLIVTSSLKRAKKTAELIAQEIGYEGSILQMHELAERSGGDLQGGPIERFYKATDKEIIDAGGESLADFSERLKRAGVLLGMIALGQTVLVIGHAEAFRMTTTNVLGMTPEEYLKIAKPANAQVYQYPMTPEDKSNHEKMTEAFQPSRQQQVATMLR